MCVRAYLARAARWVWERRTVRGSPTASQRPGARNSRGRASLIGTSRCVDQQSAPAARGVPTGWTSHGLQGGMSGRPAARRSPIMAGTTCASERTRFEDLSGKHSHTLRLLPVYRQLDGPLTRHLVWVRLCPAAPFAAPAPGTTRARQWRRLWPLWRATTALTALQHGKHAFACFCGRYADTKLAETARTAPNRSGPTRPARGVESEVLVAAQLPSNSPNSPKHCFVTTFDHYVSQRMRKIEIF